MPNFAHEKRLWDMGQLVAGFDEVGRGAFAGPLVVGVVVFSPFLKLHSVDVDINDSKLMKPSKRQLASDWIHRNALSVGIGGVSSARIDSEGLSRAFYEAANIAICEANSVLASKGEKTIDYLLCDAFQIRGCKHIPEDRQVCIVHGDRISMTIAAASIVAKVHRDKIMCDAALKKEYSVYFWQANKGYGTKKHREAILLHGTTPLHRKSFLGKLKTNDIV